MSEAEKYERNGLTVKILYDEDPPDPRDADNLGVMFCWHPRYVIGDEQFKDDWGRGARRDRGDGPSFGSLEEVETYLRDERGALILIPLYLLDHSGLSISAGAPSIADTPSGGRDAWGNPRGWDTTMVGFMYTSQERIDALGCEQMSMDEIAKSLVAEVNEYDLYLTGQGYGFVIELDGEEIESCWGFLGAKYVEEEANSLADLYTAEDLAKHREEFRQRDIEALKTRAHNLGLGVVPL